MSKQSKQYILRAMAKNYADSGHSWDHLDSQVCTEAADEIDQLHDANQRLEGEVKRLRVALDSALELFPFQADRQKFNFDGREIKADGDDLFFSVKRTENFLCAVHAALSTANGEVTE